MGGKGGGGKKGGGGGGAQVPQELIDAQIEMIQGSNRMANQSAEQQAMMFNMMQGGIGGGGGGRRGGILEQAGLLDRGGITAPTLGLQLGGPPLYTGGPTTPAQMAGMRAPSPAGLTPNPVATRGAANVPAVGAPALESRDLWQSAAGGTGGALSPTAFGARPLTSTVSGNIGPLMDLFTFNANQLGGLADQFGGEALRRRGQEEALLGTQLGTAGRVADVGMQAGARGQRAGAGITGMAPRFLDTGNLDAQRAMAAQAGVNPFRDRVASLGAQTTDPYSLVMQDLLGRQATDTPFLTRQSQLGVGAVDLGTIAQQRGLGTQAVSSQFMQPMTGLAGQAGSPQFMQPRQALAGQAGAGIDTTSPAAAIMSQAGQVGALGQQTGRDLGGLRGQTLDTLSQVAQGQIPQQITDMFRSSGAAERDILERQFQNAQNQLMERSTRGGLQAQNLAAMDTNRAIELSRQEQARGDQQRQLLSSLFGTATEQGLTAPGQQAALLGQAGNLFGMGGQQLLGAEQTRQGQVGLGADILSGLEQQRQGQVGLGADILRNLELARQGQLGLGSNILGSAEQQRQGQFGLGADIFGNLEQQRQAGIGLGANIFGNREQQRLAQLGMGSNIFGNLEQQRQSGLGLGAGIFGNVEQQRQAGLGGALQAMNQGAQLDLQSSMMQQQALAQSQQLAQALAGQFGAGADQYNFAIPGILGQQTGMAQTGALLPAVPGQLMSGMQVPPASGFLGPAMQGLSSMAGQNVQAQLANQQAAAANNAGMMNLLGTLGMGAAMFFT